jgi:PAS domain S-box-containing protein
MGKASSDSLDFKALFEATPGAYLILAPDFTIIAVNDAYCRATMTVREEILGRNLFEVFPDNPDDAQATGESNLRSSLNRVLELRRPDVMAIQKYDIRRPASEGGGFEERHWSPLNAPLLDGQGRVVAIIHRVQDVTDLVRLEAESVARDKLAQEQHAIIFQLRNANQELARRIDENRRLERERHFEVEAHQATASALAESEVRFRTLAENLPGIVYRRIVKKSGEIHDRFVSEGVKKFLGVEPELLMSGKKSLLDYIHPDDSLRNLAAMKDAASRSQPLVIEVRKLVQPGGDVRWWQIHTTPTNLGNGDIQWDGIALDITDRKAAQQQLQQALKMDAVGQLTGGIAHDFNNLLTVILGNAELLADQLTDNQRLRSLAQLTQTAAERGAELTNHLLAFARRQTLEPRSVDVNRLTAGLDAMLRRTLGESIEIEFVRGAGLWNAVVDPTQLESALLNLAINARDAMPGGGRLTIETANAYIDDTYAATHEEVATGQYVLIAVSDTGTGMDAATAARAFEPFFSTKEIGKGTGLGLSMVYGFVKQSGGHVKIYSESGHGTTVKIYLQRSNDARTSENANGGDQGKELRGAESILLVEDDDIVRRHVESQLRELGYEVRSANNGPAAMAVLRTEARIDLLFTDMVMPGGMNGRDLAQAALVLRPGLKVLFTSGYAENAALHQGRLDRTVQLIRKPYRRRDLAAKLRQILETGQELS